MTPPKRPHGTPVCARCGWRGETRPFASMQAAQDYAAHGRDEHVAHSCPGKRVAS